jgi:hypothetical protein
MMENAGGGGPHASSFARMRPGIAWMTTLAEARARATSATANGATSLATIETPSVGYATWLALSANASGRAAAGA